MRCYRYFIVLFFIMSFQCLNAQQCSTAEDWENETLGEPLQMSAQFGGYYAINGNPQFVSDNCTPGGAVGLRLQAGIDGAVGDVVGYTQSFGINPSPTFLNGVAYNISGKKLYTNSSMGTYTNITMTITLVGGSGATQVVNKSLMLIQGQCDSWDPPQTFVSPGDFDLAEITITADNGAGEDELFIVIDDWCIEEVQMCTPEISFVDLGCGNYEFTSIGGPNDSGHTWEFIPPSGLSIIVSGNPANVAFPTPGIYQVMLDVICEDGSAGSTTISVNVDFDQDPPVFESCPDGQTIIIPGMLVDGECFGTIEIPDYMATDASMIVSQQCFFDGALVTGGSIIMRSPGTYILFCTAVDECENEGQCQVTYLIEECESDEPCEYSCCLDGPNWPIEDYVLGDLPSSNPTGFYTEYGSPQVVIDGCDGSTQSIELEGITFGSGGDAAGLRNQGIPPLALFEMGNTYCISYCMKVGGEGVQSAALTLHASNVSQTNATCTGPCEVIGQSRIVSESEGWVMIQNIYTPTVDYDNLVLLNNESGIADFPPTILFDNVCISLDPEPIVCKVDLIIEEQECGKVVVNTDICGELEEMTFIYSDGFQSYEIEDTIVCIDYTSAGPWTVTVEYICVGETDVKSVSETFILENKIGGPIITCPNDTLITLDPEGDCIAELLLGSYSVDDPSATVQCFLSGILVTNPIVPILIPAGVAQVEYIATNECGSDTCTYEITVSCEPTSKYDCPVDFLFILDNSGSIQGNEFASMQTSVLNEITMISGIYTNSRFGVLHYSGTCGANISIEHDFQNGAGITSVNRQFSNIYNGFMDDLNESLGATINALNGTPDSNISSPTASLSYNAASDLYIVIFTDASDGPSLTGTGGCTNSALKPYNNINTLKNSFGANVSLVHFMPNLNDMDVGAAIASPGGNYTGAVDTNPGDPDNGLLPRQYISANFGVTPLNLLDILPPCEPCFDCDNLVLSANQTNEDSCCYSIDFNNGIGPDIVKMEAEIITPDWQFNTATTNPGSGFQWYPGTVTTGTKLCLTGNTNTIPAGANIGILDYCFSPAVASPSGPQTVVFKYYTLLNDSLFELQCTDTISTECMPMINDPCITVDDIDILCNPDNAYEYDISLIVTNSSGFTASNVTLYGLGSGFQFAQCGSSTGVSSIAVPIPGGFSDGTTRSICVKIIAPFPILNPNTICFNIGINSFMDCCHSPDEVCVTLDKCCDPCQDITTTYTPISVTGQEDCCYSLQIDYECDYLFFNKINIKSTTPGVTFGYHALGNPSFKMCGSSATDLCIEPLSSPLAKGAYLSVMDICFDEINDPSQIPQLVTIEYLTSDPITNLDSVACTEDLIFECDIVDNKCLEVTNQDLVCIPDSMKYRYTFDIKNVSSPGFTATDVDVFILAPTDLIFTPSGGTFPLTPPLTTGSSQTISSCIESTSTFPSTATEIVFGYRLRYNAGDTCCYESILDTIAIPPCDDIPDECFSVVDVEIKDIQCEVPDCYGDPFCQAWLVAKINAYTYFPPASASMSKAIYNGRTVFIWEDTYIDGIHREIYECDGTLIQECWQFFPSAESCSLDAGIDITTDLSSVQLVWDVTMADPTYDPLACLSSSTNTVVDYCVKIMNNSPAGFNADQLDLSGISPSGVVISPNSHAQNIPSGGMATINFSVAGNFSAGDIIKVEGLLSGLDPMESPWECMDTICLEVPPCPIDSCCTDEDQFLADVAQGFAVTQIGNCTYQVCANQFDSCHYFGTLSPDWGDGSVTLPAINQSNPPNNCWTYTYATNGTFKISMKVYEGNPSDNESCWEGDICATVVTDCCMDDPCDNVSVTTTSISTTTDSCCTLFGISNTYCDDYFKGIRVEIAAPGAISQINGLNGYVINQLTPQVAEVRPLFGFVGFGSLDVFSLCTTGYTATPHQVTVSWLVPGAGDTCVAECPSVHDISCDIDPPVSDKCYEFVSDSIHCESNTYCFKIKNTSSPAFDINSVELFDLSGTLGLSPTGRITIPTLPSGAISDWICVNYYGVNPGDNSCFKISAHNTPAGVPPTSCCTDTLVTCFTVPACPQEVCGICPDGSTAGPNLVPNGDFEQGNGYFGWASGYTLQTAGLMGANQYSVRNATNLSNSQWSAIDHTTGSPTGQFLAIDGPSGNVAYLTTVFVTPNTDYVFCMWVDNLVATSTPSNPVLEIKIDNQVVEPGRWLPQSPDGWQLITLPFYSISASGQINIEVTDISGSNYNDWAIDDVSFRTCEPVVVDDCCDVTVADILTYYGLNTVVDRDSCDICLTFPIDSCDIFEFRYDDEPFVSYTGSPVICKSYSDAGPHFYSYRITRFDLNGDTCFHDTFNAQFDLLCDPDPDPDPCCDGIDEDALDSYYAANIIFDTSDCNACVIVDLDSCDVGTITFAGNAPQSILDNTQSCVSYSASGSYSYIIDIVRYDGDGDTCYHYQSQATFELNCGVDPPIQPCVQVVADSIDCETNTYCFKVRNNTTPGWTIRSLAFVNESTGHTLTPDPISISPLTVGDTTDWLCVSYVASVFDTVCFNLVAHQEDIAAGEEPQFCCSNPEPVCFIVPDCQQCLMCPDSSIQGPNLVMNSDFEGGYIGFTSDYILEPTGQLGLGSYSIRNSTNLGNSQWTAVDHTTGAAQGNFLVIDGPSDQVAYRTTVAVKPNTQYIFCVYAANLVNSDIESDPTIEISIDGAVQIPGLTIPKQVGRWWVISVPYFSGSVSGMVDIELKDIDTDPFNDWAIDDVSFRECIQDKVCCEDEDLFDDLLDIGWTVSVAGCEVTVSAPQLDSCHWLSQSELDWDDGSVAGQVITSATGSWTHTYTGEGVYTICATIFEGDDPDDICFSGEMCTEVEIIDCAEPPVPCTASDVTIFNAITPNGDGINDFLFINGGDDCLKNIKVYNRWGQLVWSEEGYKNDWSGQSFSGEELTAGTYFLVLEFPELNDEEDRMKQTYIEIRE